MRPSSKTTDEALLVDDLAETAGPGEHPYAARALAVLQVLGGDLTRGLDTGEVEARRRRFGSNTLQTIRSRSAWRILLDQLASIIVALLAAAALVAWITGDAVEAIAILVVLALNTLVGFATEWKAGHALEALRRQARAQARVRRDGCERTVDAEDLVIGDCLILHPGDCVPADARLVEVASLRADESVLTGESATVGKQTGAVATDAPLAERYSMLYMGTTIAAGRAVAVVTATGEGTELGRIGQLVAGALEESSPLEQRLEELGRRLVRIVIIIAAVVMIVGWLRGDGLWVMVEVSISLAVAAVPEGLPAVTTLTLALGVLNMARRQAIVRRLPAVETLGSATIICSDKTGTLTENRMTVRKLYLADGRIIDADKTPASVDTDPLLARAARVGTLCNEAFLDASDTRVISSVGDPTEVALLAFAHKLGINVRLERLRWPKLDERPFDAATKCMITAYRAPDGECYFAMKGAPSVVIDACSNYASSANDIRPLDRDARARSLAANDAMAEQSLRVLALAERRAAHHDRNRVSEMQAPSGYTLLGLVGMIDPPRPGVAEAIERARDAGIRVVMLTGDQINTAQAIARDLGLSGTDEPQALHARDLAGADDNRLAELARATDVFARVSPEDKLRIVEALEKAGEVVAVTGDGVNDAPALKRANIGIAMGMRGTEVAKEASDLVLADDNFATIMKAVESGRTIYANITKFIHMMFSHNLGEVIVIFVAIAIGWPLPLLPLQILWMNLVTDVFPALALAVEPPSPEVMRRPPRPPREKLLSRAFIFLITWQGAMLASITLSAYAWALSRYGEGAHARTIALLVLINAQLGHLFNCRSRTRSAFASLMSNPFIWAAAGLVAGLQLLSVYFEPLSRLLTLERLAASDWAFVAGSLLAPIAIVEITKLVARRRKVRSQVVSVQYPDRN